MYKMPDIELREKIPQVYRFGKLISTKVIIKSVITGVLFIFIFLNLYFPLYAIDKYNSEAIIKDRIEKDKFFKSGDSPLKREQRLKFKAINYYPVTLKFVFNAKIIPFTKKDTINILTSKKNDVRKMIRYGKIEFHYKGKIYSLSAYYSLPLNEEASLFLPFGDETNGKQTYKGGRYLDIDSKPGTKEIILDFNLAYNPYCAYNNKWSCPLIPSENLLKIKIEAGEKKFK